MSSASLLDTDRERSEQAAAWAVRLADGAMPAQLEDEFSAWLEADPLNAEAFDQVVGAWQSVDRYAASAEIVALRESALASARKTLLGRRRHDWGRAWVAGLVAAMFLVVAGGAGLWLWTSPQVYETGVGERRVVALPDGSKMSLDGATRVKVSYSDHERRLWLEQGRAKFDVAKDHSRPFHVAAADRAVLAVGTSFSVELIENEVRVILYEGKVRLLGQEQADLPPAEAVKAVLDPVHNLATPGWQAILPDMPAGAPEIEAPPLASPAPANSLSWEAGQLVFEDEMLSVVVARMNRYATKPIVIGDMAAANLRVSGVFRGGDTDALVQGLVAAFGITARTDADSTTLYGEKLNLRGL